LCENYYFFEEFNMSNILSNNEMDECLGACGALAAGAACLGLFAVGGAVTGAVFAGKAIVTAANATAGSYVLATAAGIGICSFPVAVVCCLCCCYGATCCGRGSSNEQKSLMGVV
jgi:hypothetical protein